jgi:hypothetical protein
MDMPNFDDGFDMFAPPTPETSIVNDTPIKLCDTEVKDKLWLFPIFVAISIAVSGLAIWGLIAILK